MTEENKTQAPPEARIAELEDELRRLKAKAEAEAEAAAPAEAPLHPAWLRVKLARHPKRPHSLDYIQRARHKAGYRSGNPPGGS